MQEVESSGWREACNGKNTGLGIKGDWCSNLGSSLNWLHDLRHTTPFWVSVWPSWKMGKAARVPLLRTLEKPWHIGKEKTSDNHWIDVSPTEHWGGHQENRETGGWRDSTLSSMSLSKAAYSEDAGSGLLRFQLTMWKLSQYLLQEVTFWVTWPAATERKKRQLET